MYDSNTRLKFGKYKGIILKEVEERDPSYILWLINNVKMFKNWYTTEEINYFKKNSEI